MNRIPRKFNTITGKMLIDTNCNKRGDELRIYKEDSGYHALNVRTGERFHMFLSMLRDGDIFQMTEVI